mmetsp:Transcript_6976/g.16609  ORF Transcript_6976/g.16609 Transcript_6976/m.16609 type:complete len:279 (-) Transcript_6976:87-923(-)
MDVDGVLATGRQVLPRRILRQTALPQHLMGFLRVGLDEAHGHEALRLIVVDVAHAGVLHMPRPVAVFLDGHHLTGAGTLHPLRPLRHHVGEPGVLALLIGIFHIIRIHVDVLIHDQMRSVIHRRARQHGKCAHGRVELGGDARSHVDDGEPHAPGQHQSVPGEGVLPVLSRRWEGQVIREDVGHVAPPHHHDVPSQRQDDPRVHDGRAENAAAKPILDEVPRHAVRGVEGHWLAPALLGAQALHHSFAVPVPRGSGSNQNRHQYELAPDQPSAQIHGS